MEGGRKGPPAAAGSMSSRVFGPLCPPVLKYHLPFANNCLVMQVIDGQVQCAYHGWMFNGQGACTKMPSTPFCKGVGVVSLPCVEKDGFVWVWPGDKQPGEVRRGGAEARWS